MGPPALHAANAGNVQDRLQLRAPPHGGVLLTFVGVGFFAAIDTSVDIHQGTTLGHVVAEAGILLVAMLGSGPEEGP